MTRIRLHTLQVIRIMSESMETFIAGGNLAKAIILALGEEGMFI
jgi:hypothetical protein